MTTEDVEPPAQPVRRLKLVMPQTNPEHQQPGVSHSREPSSSNKASSGSPERPSYSPVTPTLAEAVLPTHQSRPSVPQRPAEFMNQPEPLPVSLDDNSDAIAMRAALSILQMQRQQSLRDIRDLDKLKTAAAQDPDGFIEHLKATNLSNSTRDSVDVDYDETTEDESEEPETSSKFPRFPSAQNVVRAPPVEWRKYGIVGEPLEKMHEVQRIYPGWTDNGTSVPPTQEPHRIATPYKPFTDRLNDKKK